jgi:GNAT superfamily N-acetyltransferase
MIRVKQVSHRHPLLAELQAECLPGDDPYQPRAGDLWYIAFVDGVPAGFAAARETASAPGCWFLARAGVVPAFRGAGLQVRLIRARMRGLAARGGQLAYTYTLVNNPASARSLITAGFRPYTPQWRWVGDGVNYWMKRCSPTNSPRPA